MMTTEISSLSAAPASTSPGSSSSSSSPPPPPLLKESSSPISYCVTHKLADSSYGPILLAQRDAINLTASSSSSSPKVVVVKEISLARAKDVLSRGESNDSPWQELRVIEILMSEHDSHQHVVRFHQAKIDSTTDELQVVMEYCTGGDLFTQIVGHTSSTGLEEKEALWKLTEIATALQFLHQHDIAHRDLSLENILVGDDGKCKISDFGQSTCASLWCHDRVGKSYYMAPEVAHGDKEYDPVKADIWSLGILLFMMLTGSALWDMDNVSDAVVESVNSRGASWVVRSWGYSCMAATMDLLDGMLRVNPCERLSLEKILVHPAVVWIQRQDVVGTKSKEIKTFQLLIKSAASPAA